jgi:ATP-dependent Lon protease
MEIIRLSGYITEEKIQIARRYLIPKQVERHGLKRGDVKLDARGLSFIIQNWARESGVRNLERQIERICRKTAMIKSVKPRYKSGILTGKNIREYLGQELYSDDELFSVIKPGIVVGLAWTELGGATLVVESICLDGQKGGGLTLTGHMGDVMSESANIAYSYVKHMLSAEPARVECFREKTIHLHVPAGATPKDGPSAGITMASSMFSLLTGRRVRKNVAMTGELTLTGRVLPVGGVKEKVIAAKRAGFREIILPGENRKDLQDIPAYIQKGMSFHFVKEMDEVIGIAFKK